MKSLGKWVKLEKNMWCGVNQAQKDKHRPHLIQILATFIYLRIPVEARKLLEVGVVLKAVGQ